MSVDPLDIGLDHFALTGLHVAGHRVDVTFRRGDGLRVTVDGVEAVSARGLGSSRVPLS